MNLPKLMRFGLFGIALGVVLGGGSSLLFSSSVPTPTTRVLLIAVPEYENPGLNKLPSARKDVMELAQTFRERNENVQVRVLGAGKGDRPTRKNIGNEINNWLAKESKKEDTLIFFFTGHGFVDPKEPSKTYLVSCDCDPQNPQKTGVPVDGLRKLIEKCKARHKFMIIDSCHAGANPFGAGIDPLKQFVNHSGVITLASAKSDEKSMVWKEQDMSLFSYWLNEGLKGHADENKSGYVSVDELYRYVYENVTHSSKQISKKETQTPVRIIGPDVAGIPEFVQLKPTSLDLLLDDIVEQIAMQLKLKRINRAGILSFTIEPHGNFLEPPEEYELVKLYCASEVERRLPHRFKTKSYDIYGQQLTQEAISTKNVNVAGAPDQQAKPEKPQEEPLKIQGKPVGALLKGNVLGRKTHRYSMQCTLVNPNSDDVITVAGGTAILTPNDWMMFGGSVNFVPQIRQALSKQNVKQGTTTLQSVNAKSSESAIKSLAHLPTGFLLNIPEKSPEALIERLDELSKQTHPLLNQEFPFRIEIYVKSQSQSESEPYTQKRSRIPVGNQVYFPLEENEVYQIRISADPKLLPPLDSVGVKVLVDGLNTFPEAEVAPKEGHIQAKRVLLGNAIPWAMPLDRPLKINGFYLNPTDAKQNAKYNEFQVTKRENAHAIQLGETDMKQIGLISVVFYVDATQPRPVSRGGSFPYRNDPTTSSNQLSSLGTKLGEQLTSEIEVRACKNIGPQLAVVHLRYDSKQKIEERLKNYRNRAQNPTPAAP